MKTFHPSFPVQSFKWLSMGWGFTLIVWGMLWMGVDIQAFSYGGLLVPLSVLTGIGGFFLGFDVFLFVSGMGKTITLTDTHMLIGKEQIDYSHIRAFRYDLGSCEYLFFVHHREKAIPISQDMYSEFADIYDTLLSKIYDRLIDDYQQRLRRGEQISFGKDIFLSSRELILNRDKILLENIKKIRTFTHSENSSPQQYLLTETLQGKKYKTQAKLLDNLPIFLEIISESCPNITTGL